MYYGAGGTIAIHLTKTVRLSQIRNLIHLDWQNVSGSIEVIKANLKKVENLIQMFQFSSSGDNTSINYSEIWTDPNIAYGQVRDMPEGEMVSALPHVSANSHQLRLEKAVVFENEEKKRITEQLLKIHRAVSRGLVPAIINADACQLIADRLIEEDKEAEESNQHNVNKRKQKIA